MRSDGHLTRHTAICDTPYFARPRAALRCAAKAQRTLLAGTAGFTLIEVLVVLAILAMALGVLAARGPAGSPALELREATSEIAQTLRLGRSRAIAAARPVPVVLDMPAHALTLDGAVRPRLPAAISLKAAMADGSIPTRQAVFVFAADGSATGGSIALGAGTRRFAVSVDWLTGRVAVDAR